MSASQFLLLPPELRRQIISYLIIEDLFSLIGSASLFSSPTTCRSRSSPSLLRVNQQLREEYLDVLSKDQSITLYIFYPETAMWDIIRSKAEKVETLLGSQFTDLFHLNSLASAERLVEHGNDRAFGCTTGGRGMCGILALAEEGGGSQAQRFWRWEGGG